MKICSVCQQCYDDSVAICAAAEDHGALTHARQGNCSVVGGYKINSRFASDSFFEIYRAAHLSFEENVLIRFIKIDATEEAADTFAAELQSELQSAVAVNHPNLGRVYEYGTIDKDEFFVVLEDAAGQGLDGHLEKASPLKELRAIKIARQLAEALAALHKSKIVHRAINPSNIYLENLEDQNIRVKLYNFDFGGIRQKTVARTANAIDAKIDVLRYFSPEQFTSDKVDLKSDIYSLNVVFYEMLLGRSPYKVPEPQAITDYVFNETDVDKLHFDLRALLAYTLRQSLQRRLDLRPPTADNLARQLRHLELVATPPPAITIQNTVSNQPTAQKRVDVSQSNKERSVAPPVAAESISSKPAIVETVAVLESSPLAENEYPDSTIRRFNAPMTNENSVEKIDATERAANFAGEKFLNESVDSSDIDFDQKPEKNKLFIKQHSAKGFGPYIRTQSLGFSKTSLYTAAGILAVLVLSGLMTARILNRQGVIEANFKTFATPALSSSSNVAQTTDEIVAAKKADEIKEPSENSKTPQSEEEQEKEFPKLNETVAVQTRIVRDLQNASASKIRNKTSILTGKAKNSEPVAEKNSTNSAPVGKKSFKPQLAKNLDAVNKKTTVKKTNGEIRPRVVTNAKAYD